MDVDRVNGLEAQATQAGHRQRRDQGGDPTLPSRECVGSRPDGGGAPTLEELQRVICCPTGVCSAPEDCYALRRDRDVPVRIDQAALAVLRLLKRARSPRGRAPEVPVVPLTTHRPGVFTIDDAVGIPQDSAWQPLPDRSPLDRQRLRQP